MKRTITFLIIIAMVLAVSSISYAASSRRGKKVFAKVCGACHVKGSEAKRIKPSDKTMAQWKRFIEKNNHDADLKVIEGLSSKDKANLIKFLQEYAADAAVAETCG